MKRFSEKVLELVVTMMQDRLKCVRGRKRYEIVQDLKISALTDHLTGVSLNQSDVQKIPERVYDQRSRFSC